MKIRAVLLFLCFFVWHDAAFQTVYAAQNPVANPGFEDKDKIDTGDWKWVESSDCLADDNKIIRARSETTLYVTRLFAGGLPEPLPGDTDGNNWMAVFHGNKKLLDDPCNSEFSYLSQEFVIPRGYSRLRFQLRIAKTVAGWAKGNFKVKIDDVILSEFESEAYRTEYSSWKEVLFGKDKLSSFADGQSHTLRFEFKLDNTSPNGSDVAFLVDNVIFEPEGFIENPPDSPTKQTAYDLKIDPNAGLAKYSFTLEKIGGEAPISTETCVDAASNIVFKLTPGGTQDGDYKLVVTGYSDVDCANQVDAPTEVTWTLDTTPPEITQINAKSAGPVKVAEWNWVVADQNWTLPDPINPITYYYVIDQNPLSTINETDPKTVNTASKDGVNGDWYIHVKAKDAAGNVGGIKDSAKVLLDNTAPTLTIARDPDADSNSAPYTITLTATDANDVKQRQYRLNTSQPWSNYSDPVTVSDAGTHTFFARAEDNAGNETLRQISFTIAYRGNINGDTKIDLKDAILALKILAGLPPDTGETVKIEFSVDEMKIALADVIYVLQVVSRSRTAF